MSSPDAVIAAIDGALTDYAVSDDAMRWTPDEPTPDEAPRPRFDPTAAAEYRPGGVTVATLTAAYRMLTEPDHILLCHPDEERRITRMIDSAGFTSRFEIHASAAVPVGQLYTIDRQSLESLLPASRSLGLSAYGRVAGGLLSPSNLGIISGGCA